MNLRKLTTAAAMAAVMVVVPAAMASASSRVPHATAVRAVVHVYTVLHTHQSWAYAGDSTTALSDSWAHQIRDPYLTRVGGYAHYGNTSQQVLDHIQPGHADVLVMMLGVNDSRTQVPMATTLANLAAIVAKFGGAKHVLITPTVPCNLTDYGPQHINRQAQGVQLNAAEKAFAAQHGWSFVDPDVDFRTSHNSYEKGSSISDGVHPNAHSFGLMASRMAIAIHYAGA